MTQTRKSIPWSTSTPTLRRVRRARTWRVLRCPRAWTPRAWTHPWIPNRGRVDEDMTLLFFFFRVAPCYLFLFRYLRPKSFFPEKDCFLSGHQIFSRGPKKVAFGKVSAVSAFTRADQPRGVYFFLQF